MLEPERDYARAEVELRGLPERVRALLRRNGYATRAQVAQLVETQGRDAISKLRNAGPWVADRVVAWVAAGMPDAPPDRAEELPPAALALIAELERVLGYPVRVTRAASRVPPVTHLAGASPLVSLCGWRPLPRDLQRIIIGDDERATCRVCRDIAVQPARLARVVSTPLASGRSRGRPRLA
jgi:hypothetical protein